MKRGTKGLNLLLSATLVVSGPLAVPVTAVADEAGDEATTLATGEGLEPVAEIAASELAAVPAAEGVGEAEVVAETAVAAEESTAVAEEAADEAPAPVDTAIHVSTYNDLKAAVAAASKDAANPTVIALDADIDTTVTTGLTVAAGTYVEITSAAGSTHTYRQNSSASMTTATQGMFVVNGSLRVYNVTIDANAKARGAYVGTTGVFTMDEGARICNGAAASTAFTKGLGVYVNGSTTAQGIFVMNEGAKISGCKTTIANYQAQGLGVYVYGGYFEMNGGEICDNIDASSQATATNYAQGGGVFVMSTVTTTTSALNDKENFVMNGGSIHDNAANAGAGVFISNYAHAHLTAGTIANNTSRFVGGGIAQFALSEAGTATSRGIDVLIEKDVAITGNKAVNGGGIYAVTGTLTINGARIADNVATTEHNLIPAAWNSSALSVNGGGTTTTLGDSDSSVASGGGIYISSATVNIVDADITGNQAVSTYAIEDGNPGEVVQPAGNGGGIYMTERKGTTVEHAVRIVDGAIAGNTASGAGDHSGMGADICASFSPYDGNSDEVYLIGTEEAPSDDAAAETTGLTIGELAVPNTLPYRVQEFALPVDKTAYAAPVVALAGVVTIGSVALGAPVEGHEEANVVLYAPDALQGRVTLDATALPVGYEAVAGANGYLLRTADLGALALTEASGAKALGFNAVGNIAIAEKGDEAADLTAAKVEVAAATYTGEALRPAVTVTLGEKQLEAGVDYSVSYADNVQTGTATVVVNGRGAYAGTIETTFEIAPRPLSSEGIATTAPSDYFVTGEALKPVITVTDGSTELVQGEDYLLSYRDNVAAGTAFVVIEGQGNYAGTIEVPFTLKELPEATAFVRTTDELTTALADESVESITFGADIAVSEPFTVDRLLAIDGNGFTLAYEGADTEAAITVLDGGGLTLLNTTVSCPVPGTVAADAGKGARPLQVNAGGHAILRNDVLAGKKNAAGLSVLNYGTVEMTDVLVKNALNNSTTHSLTYDGVLHNEGTMVLNDGVRFENSVSRRGYVLNTGADANLTIAGADLSGSMTPLSSADCFGGAVTVLGGTVTMTSGRIANTTIGAAVVVKTGGTFVLAGGEIVDNKQSTWYTGAVYVYTFSTDKVPATFVMTGGTIARNTCVPATNKTSAAGGVLISGSQSVFRMEDGIIEENTAFMGGGVGVYMGDFTMNGGTIRNNVAQKTSATAGTANGNSGYALGGGVAVVSSGNVRQSTFTMNGGTIEGNSASLNPLTVTTQIDFDHTGLGGGVYVMGSQFTMNGGAICNNSVGYVGPKAFANGAQGAGVYLADVKAAHRANVSLLGGSITGNTLKINGMPSPVQAGADVYASQWMNLVTTSVGAPTINFGNAAKVGELKLSGSDIMLNLTEALTDEAHIDRLVADNRTTAGSQVARYAEGVEPHAADLSKLGYNSVLGLALSKDDPHKVVLGVLDLSGDGYEVTLDDAVYTGKPIDAAGLLTAHVKVAEGEVIDLPALMDIDVVTQTDNCEVGTAKVRLKGNGNLVTGEVDATFAIVPRPLNETGFTLQLGDQTLFPASGRYTYTGEAFEATGASVQPPVKIALDNLITDDDPGWIDPTLYEVTYGENITPGSGTVKLTAKDVPGTRYTGSVTVTFDLCGKRMDDLTTNVPEQTVYTGSAQYGTANLQVFDADGNKLRLSTHYKATLTNNTNVGTATLKMTGAGDYAKRTRTITFEIVPIDLADEGVAKLSATQFAYTGKAITAPTRSVNALTATLLNNNTTLAFTDAEGNEVASTALVNAGKYYAVIAGKPYTTGGVTYNNVVGEARIPFYIGLEAITLTGAPESGACRSGDTFDLGYAVLPEGSTQTADLTWTSSNPEVATVDENGHLEALSDGTAVITVAAGGQESSFTLTVAQVLLENCDIDWGIGEYVYDGTPKEPAVTVANGDEVLQPGVDYTVSYRDNVHAGTATVTVTGNGVAIGGTLSREFPIAAAPLSACTARLAYTHAVYDPAGTYPAVTVEGLAEGTDYQVDYINAVDAGTAYARVTGCGDWEGTLMLSYEIERSDIADSLVYLSYTTDTFSPRGTLPSVKAPALAEGDYEVVFLDGAWYRAGKHQVRVTGIGNCKGSVQLEYEVQPANIALAMLENVANVYNYTGSPITPVPVVGFEGEELYQGWDFALSYINNIGEGSATMVLQGIGNYTGVLTRSFLIEVPTVKQPDTVIKDDTTVLPSQGGTSPEQITSTATPQTPASSSGGSVVAPTRTASTGNTSSGKLTVAAPTTAGDNEDSDLDDKLSAAEKVAAERTTGTADNGLDGIKATVTSEPLVEAQIDEDGTALAGGMGSEEALAEDGLYVELIGLIVLVLAAAGVGGFFLFRYLRARSGATGEGAEEAVAASSPMPY